MSALSEYMQEEGLSFTRTPDGEHAVCNTDLVKLMGLSQILEKANIPFEQKSAEGIFVADDHFRLLERQGISVAPPLRTSFTAVAPPPKEGQYTQQQRDKTKPLSRDGVPLVDGRGHKLY